MNEIAKIRESIDALFGSPMAIVSDCLRGFIIAAPGYDLIAVDFASIEARVIAWLAREERVLEIFRTHGLIYEDAASAIYHVPMREIHKEDPRRLVGKVAILALGFGGGNGALATMGANYGIALTGTQAEFIKNNWRTANPNIVRYWKTLENAARTAIQHPGTTTKSGTSHRDVCYLVKNGYLWCRLPSGRLLAYPEPALGSIITPWGQAKHDSITYMAEDPVTKKWKRFHTHGGSLSENVTQGVARDVLAAAIVRCEERGYPIVMHIHDELVAERPQWEGSLEEMISIAEESPGDWAKDLPIKAEGWRGPRYRK